MAAVVERTPSINGEADSSYSNGENGTKSPEMEQEQHETDGKRAIKVRPSNDRIPLPIEGAATPTITPTIKGHQIHNLPPDSTPRVATPTIREPGDTAEPPPESRGTPASRNRTESVSTTATGGISRSGTRSSLVFVVTALDTIASSKDARRNKKLGDAAQKALSAIKSDGDPARINPELLFDPLQLASEANTVQVVTTALDCIGKLISYSYFSVPASLEAGEGSDQPPLIERAIDTICDCFQSEATPVEVQLQIVKSLLAAILNDKIVVHGAGLLKAVRLTYNIFLFSKSSPNQQVAQGALTQMVGTVFERVKSRLAVKETRSNDSKTSLGKNSVELEAREPTDDMDAIDGSETNGVDDPNAEGSESTSTGPGDVSVEKQAEPKITLQSFENRKSFDDAKIQDNAPTLVTRVKGRKPSLKVGPRDLYTPIDQSGSTLDEDEEDEIYMKDAYLVFRAMCRLSTKTMPGEHVLDVKSPSMRSKLLALHIIHTILFNHITVFVSPHSTIKSSTNDEPTSFVQAIKQYLCLSLSRNGASNVNRVFDVSLEIFWLMLKSLRVMLKKELEVFLKEIYIAILDKRAAPVWQKQAILSVFNWLAADGRALVEVYLNYDCDRTALDNIFERIVEHLSRIASMPLQITALQHLAFADQRAKTGPYGQSDWQNRGQVPPSLATAAISAPADNDLGYPPEYAMMHESLEALVEILRSLVNWSATSQTGETSTSSLKEPEPRQSFDEPLTSIDSREPALASPIPGSFHDQSGTTTPVTEDDPGALEREKRRKTAMTDAVRQFNFKPKRGIKAMLKDGFIKSDAPQDVARFLITNDRISKVALGEFLGEGNPENIAIMHAFVDLMDFRQTRFVDALRRFLQSFRLPGEAQKIDRLMEKFAARYISGNPKAFANAETAYVLAYSVVMLNTDQHSSNVKKRMMVEDFIKNNRGINDGQDLPDDYLASIFTEIAGNEIVLDTERATAANLGFGQSPASSGIAASIGQAFSGRDAKREAGAQASEEISNKTEQLYKMLLRQQRKSRTEASRFIPATSSKHVGPMFHVTWMSFLTSLSGVAQNTQNLETVRLCLEGLRLAVRISCEFDLADPRQAFVAGLSSLTNLYNFRDMKAKNVEALKVLIEVAQTEGNGLKESWRDILTCVSQLDRFQLISTGVDEGAVPDVFKSGHQLSRTNTGTSTASRKSLAVPANRGHRPRTASGNVYASNIAQESRSVDIVRGVDHIFTNTANLSGEAILEFVKALTQVSWQEIQSSGQSPSPRTYSLQKLVEVCNYNMTRVRFEWTQIWFLLGAHFNEVGCHTNTTIVFFALDSLRQLSMRFMEIEELPGFKFQKDFLKPFEHVIAHTSVVPVKDMVLRCLIQMIQARGENIRSGWRTMFGVFTVAARESYEAIVNMAYDNVTHIYNTRFGVVISQAAFADLIVCLTQFAKNMRYQKKSLQAIETLKSSVPKMLRTPECPLSRRRQSVGGKMEPREMSDDDKQPSQQTQEEQFWFPVLFAFHDVLMTGEDLEVRSRAQKYLFETLINYGGDYPRDFWDTLWRQLLYPIFMVLRSKSEMSKVVNHEELSVWLSTTMIEALRNMISLFTHFYESLEYMLDRFLDLLTLCICQENDTLARIGSNCLQQLILQNVKKFESEHWNKLVGAFVELFNRTEATALFSAVTTSSLGLANTGANGSKTPKTPTASDPRDLNLNGSPTPTVDKHPNSTDDQDAAGLGINGLPSHSRSSTVTSDVSNPSSHQESAMPKLASTMAELEDYSNPDHSSLQQTPVPVSAARRRLFNQIITKCVLQLLMIETVNELFSNDAVYAQIPSDELLRLMALLKKSYQFAKRFNNDRDLRTRLWREGFMKQPPNLLKQESGAAAVYVNILLRMYHDPSPRRVASKEDTEQALVPLCADIVTSYVELDEETQQRNIVTWRPVVVDVLEGYTGFPAKEFEKRVDIFAPLVVALMGRDMGPELQRAVQGLLARMFEVKMGVDCLPWVGGGVGLGVGSAGATPASRRGSVAGGSLFGRRGSKDR